MGGAGPSGRAHAVLTHTLRVDAPPDDVLDLLTPEGERRWVPGWAPVYVGVPTDAPAPALSEGLCFRTDHGGETTLWCVDRVDASARRYAYHRFTPGSRVGRVTVACVGPDAGPTTVDVTYEMLGLSEEGDAAIRSMEAGFAAEVGTWADALHAVLGVEGVPS